MTEMSHLVPCFLALVHPRFPGSDSSFLFDPSSSLLRPCFFVLASSSLLLRPCFFILTSSSSLLRPRFFVLASSSSLLCPRFFVLASLSSLLRPRFFVPASHPRFPPSRFLPKFLDFCVLLDESICLPSLMRLPASFRPTRPHPSTPSLFLLESPVLTPASFTLDISPVLLRSGLSRF